jgi:predicted HTH transcriptional regulator
MTHSGLKLFENGSTWVRADFHLHTKKDREFKYHDEDDFYYSNYVQGIETAGIKVGVITNHNKFDKEESGSDKRRATSREEIQRFYQSSGLIHGDETPANGLTIADLDTEYFKTFFQKNYGEPVETQNLVITLCRP